MLCEDPLVDEGPSSVLQRSSRVMPCADKQEYAHSGWCYHEHELARLLAMLFDWQGDAQPDGKAESGAGASGTGAQGTSDTSSGVML